MKKVILTISVIILLIPFLSAQSIKIKQDSTLIIFDKSAIETMYLHPNDILNNVDSFWTYNSAYNLNKQWHTHNNVEIHYNQWVKNILKISKLSESEAKNEIAYINAEKIIENGNDFIVSAIPHIFSFLHKSTPGIKTNIFLLTGNLPYAFTISENIVMDVASPNFDKNPERILNILVHEVVHIAYDYTEAYRTEFEYENKNYEYLTNYLLSEGLANYVSYTSQDIFPNHNFEDYKMLENSKQVEKQIKKINSLFSKAETISYTELVELSWKIGVLDRGYYVAGAFMAQTIDESYGRDSLINAVCTGPRKFINLYNSLVTDDLKITEFQLPETISDYQ